MFLLLAGMIVFAAIIQFFFIDVQKATPIAQGSNTPSPFLIIFLILSSFLVVYILTLTGFTFRFFYEYLNLLLYKKK
jgi:hypothetical protein